MNPLSLILLSLTVAALAQIPSLPTPEVSKRILSARLNANDASLELQHRHAGTPREGPLLVGDQDFPGAKRLLSELEMSSVTFCLPSRKTGLSEIEKGLLADEVVARRTIVGSC